MTKNGQEYSHQISDKRHCLYIVNCTNTTSLSPTYHIVHNTPFYFSECTHGCDRSPYATLHQGASVGGKSVKHRPKVLSTGFHL